MCISNNQAQLHFILRCYPINFIKKFKGSVENKIILPVSILKKINIFNTKWPLIFKITNKIKNNKKTHCGVLEFTSDENCAYVPYWILKNLSTLEGELLSFECVNLEKGNYIKIQPQTCNFMKVSNPKAILETSLRTFVCVSKKDVINIKYNNKIYWLAIIEVKPGDAVCIFDVNVNVDFVPPLFK